jgi:hypothetical protein
MKSTDLSGEYYDSVYESVDKLLAMGGYRIAALLNLIVEGYKTAEPRHGTLIKCLKDLFQH